MSKLVDQNNFEIKTINGRNYRVYKEINPIFYKDDQIIPNYNENNEKFKKFEEDDDVDSYSGDSKFLESEEEENEKEINDDNKDK